MSEVVESTPAATFSPVRSIPDFLLERSSKSRRIPEVTRCIVEPGAGVKIELDERDLNVLRLTQCS
jgi:hypothetical protein